MMPLFTAGCCGARNVGANYGITLTAWGVCGCIIAKYFAGIMDAAKQAGNAAGGYNKVYLTPAMMSIVGIVLTVIVKRPIQEVGVGEKGC